MAAAFDIHIFYTSNLPPTELINALNERGIDYSIDSIEVIDDWEFANLQAIPVSQLDTCTNLIEIGKIILLDGMFGCNRAGVMFSRIHESMYSIDLWISTKHIPMLDCDSITRENVDVLTLISKQILKSLSREALLFSCMGTELFAPQEGDLDSIVRDSKNVIRWIFPEGKSHPTLSGYTKEMVSGFDVYSLGDEQIYLGLLEEFESKAEDKLAHGNAQSSTGIFATPAELKTMKQKIYLLGSTDYVLCEADNGTTPLNNIYALGDSREIIWSVSYDEKTPEVANATPFVTVVKSPTSVFNLLATDADGIQYTIRKYDGVIIGKRK